MPSETSSNSVQNGRENFKSTFWILKRHLIAIIETVFGKSLGITEYHKKLSPPYKVFTTTLTAEWVTASTVFLCYLGVRQGWVMSALLFNITIDWVMRQTTQDKNRGIRWNLFTNLDDLDFADDSVLLSHTHTPTFKRNQQTNTFMHS